MYKKKALLLVLIVALSGCIHETLTGGELKFTASDATVNNEALSSAGYTHNSSREMTLRREFSVAGQSQEVVAINQVSDYEKSVELGLLGEARAAVFVAFSTPKVDVLGRSFNPVGEMSDRELANMVVSQYDVIQGLESAGSSTVTVVGEEATVSKFRTRAVFMGQETIDVNLHITRVEHGDDYVIGVGIYPSALEITEENNVLRMYRGLSH